MGQCMFFYNVLFHFCSLNQLNKCQSLTKKLLLSFVCWRLNKTERIQIVFFVSSIFSASFLLSDLSGNSAVKPSDPKSAEKRQSNWKTANSVSLKAATLMY